MLRNVTLHNICEEYVQKASRRMCRRRRVESGVLCEQHVQKASRRMCRRRRVERGVLCEELLVLVASDLESAQRLG